MNVEEFVVLIGVTKEINEKFQVYRDTVTLVDDLINVLINTTENRSKIRTKEDEIEQKKASKLINELQGELQRVESTEEQQKEKFKKELDKLIPDLVKGVTELKELSVDPKYLDIHSDEKEMLKDLTAKWAKYEEFE